MNRGRSIQTTAALAIACAMAGLTAVNAQQINSDLTAPALSDDAPLLLGGTVVSFQQGVSGYTGTVDTFIQQDPANVNADNSGLAQIDWDDSDPNGNDNLALIRFDNIFGGGTNQIPAGSSIISATLTYTIGGPDDPTGNPGELHNVLIDWPESVSWNTFGGDPGAQVGSEYDAAVVATLAAASTGDFTVDVTSSVQAWSDNTASNHGWIVTPTGTDGSESRSSEFGTIVNRPEFTVTYSAAGTATFTDITGASGLNNGDTRALVLVDWNNDGFIDVAKTKTNIIAVNDGDNTFTTSNVVDTKDLGMGAGDYNEDGDLDLVVDDVNLWRNNGNPNGLNWTFFDQDNNNAEAYMWMDVDGDGDVDVFCPGKDAIWYRNNGTNNLTQLSAMPGLGADDTPDGEGATVADFTGDDFPDFLWSDSSKQSTQAWTNNGNYTYTNHENVAGDFGLPEKVSDFENMEWAWGDYDNDGDLDVYISGKSDEGQGLYENDGTGFFTFVSAARGITDVGETRGADWGDYNNDGNLDLLIADQGSTRLYQNQGSGAGYSFTDVTATANVGDLERTSGFADTDNDGDLDIVGGDGSLFRNDLNNTNYLKVIVRGAGTANGGSSPTPIGTIIRVYEAGTNNLLAYRFVHASFNNLQPPTIQHFGLSGSNSYDIEVFFPSTQITRTVTSVQPSLQSTTIGGNLLNQTIEILELCNVDTDCDDQDLCTIDTCDAGACTNTPIDCDDGNECTDDSCFAGVCVNVNNTNTCDDGDACTQEDACFGGICSGQPINCNDGNPCTIDTCDNGVCVNTPDVGAACDDGDACTENDACDAGGGCAGTPIDCDDANPCTLDTCENGVCVNVPDVATIGVVLSQDFDAGTGTFNYQDDTFRGTFNPAFANGTYEATGGQTGGGVRVVVGDIATNISGGWSSSFNISGSPSSVEVSVAYRLVMAGGYENDEFGEALLSVDGTLLGVTPNDYLVQLVGNGNTPPDPMDTGWLTQNFTLNLADGSHEIIVGAFSNKSTANDEITEAFFDNILITAVYDGADGVPCDDGDACTENDACVNGVCAGTPIDCDDGNPCTIDSCAAGACVNTPDVGASCDDGDACTENDACDATGSCTGSAIDCDDANPCTIDTCADGNCANTPDVGAACDDGDACTENDACDATGGCAGSAIDCDDANPCTIDTCSSGTCVNTPDVGATCDDGDACTENDACDATGSCTGTTIDCDDANECTVDSCANGACVNMATSNGSACDDGDDCTAGDSCTDGVCGGTTVDCDDGNDCTIDTCSNGTCQNTPDVGAACDDGDDCTQNDACDAGGACTGTVIDCDDGNPCTDDSCFGGTCLNVNNTDACDDGDGCTTGDTCADGVCSGTTIDCDDGDQCTLDTCADGTCQHTVNVGGACDDGNTCTENDACIPNGVCIGAPVDCDDGNDCTIDACSDGTCENIPDAGAACDDGDDCTTGDTCSAAGACEGAAIDCDDGNPCTADTCNAGVCENNPVGEGGACDDGDDCTTNDVCSNGACMGETLDCDDGNPCTDDTCANGTCENVFNTDPCSDGDLCTLNDVCSLGVCAGVPIDCEDGNVCTDNFCEFGTCRVIRNTDPCDDGNDCTAGDTCFAGSCNGTPVDCDDGNPCTIDACSNGACDNIPDVGAACDDGDPCTTGDTCNVAGICETTPIDCDDENDCTIDSCSNGACINMVASNGTACDDGDPCTTGDACDAGTCVSMNLDCDDDNECTIDACSNGTCENVPDVGATCDDGDPCTTGDTCNAAGICETTPIDCDDDDPCTIDFCSNGMCLNMAATNGTACDDGDPCTTGDACSNGTCVSNTIDCDDGNACTIDACFNGACENEPDTGADCDDGDPCTENDACSAAGACDGAPIVCDDGDPCTADFCSNGMCLTMATSNGDACDDGDPCTDGDSCSNGLCTGDTIDCDDANACTIDACSNGNCDNEPDVGATCDDGDTCTENDTCGTNGLCAGTPIVCDDDDPCTVDTCDAGMCTFTAGNDGGACDDGDLCTENDACNAGSCAGTAISCDDGNTCTIDACSNGNCTFTPGNDGATCDDGDACTENDACSNGACLGDTLDCDDANPCTDDSCDSGSGCINDANTAGCSDDLFCNGEEICSNGVCQAGTDPCAGGPCNEVNDTCGNDCNSNGTADNIDIATLVSADTNTNGIPDECEIGILFVDDDAPPGGNGLSWTTAFDNLQDALTAAAASMGTATRIYVGQGLYLPADNGDVGLKFILQSNLRITGGFAGFGAPDPNLRDVDAFVSVLSGDHNGDDTSGGGNRTDNAFNVIVASGVDETAVVDGFLIDSGGQPNSGGGGANIVLADPTFIRCTFRACTGSLGGAVNLSNANAQFINCSFIGNSAVIDGGAIRNSGGNTFMGCVFSGNASGRDGGAISFLVGAPNLVNCTFVNNTAVRFGGGMRIPQAGVSLTSCILWNNADSEGIDESSQLSVLFAVNINYCDILGWSGGLGGTNNFGLDPLFADADGLDGVAGTLDDDVSLLVGSPCINAGDPDSIGLPDEDVYGDARVQQCRVDIGADESPFFNADCNSNGTADACDIETGGSNDFNFNGIPDDCEKCAVNDDCSDGVFCNGQELCLDSSCEPPAGLACGAGELCDEGNQACVPFGNGDFDGDGDVDLADFAGFQLCFGQSVFDNPACQPANLTGDEIVDADDLALFISIFTGP